MHFEFKIHLIYNRHLAWVSRNLLPLCQFGLKLGETNNLNSLPIKVFANKN